MSPIRVETRLATGAGAAVLGAAVDPEGAEAIGVRAGAGARVGAWAGLSVIGAAAGGGGAGVENNFLKRPNMCRAIPYAARLHGVNFPFLITSNLCARLQRL
jgi:hypothetical protein